MGVSFDKQRNKYRASYSRNGKTVHVGRYKTKQEATLALERAREDHLEAGLETIKNTKYYQEYNTWDQFDIYQPIGEPKPSLWDRIKSIWQRKPNDN